MAFNKETKHLRQLKLGERSSNRKFTPKMRNENEMRESVFYINEPIRGHFNDSAIVGFAKQMREMSNNA